jgi:hypothetical protein
MAYGIIHRFGGGTEDQYRASIGAVHPSDGSLPEGQVFHVAGPGFKEPPQETAFEVSNQESG